MEKYTWNTTFETAENTMTHVFNDSLKVVTDFKNETTTTFRDGEIIDTYKSDDMTIYEYECFLLGVARAIELRHQTSHE